jgi:hypothetical protein
MSVPLKEQYNPFRGLIRPIDGVYSTAIVPTVPEQAMKILQINAASVTHPRSVEQVVIGRSTSDGADSIRS